MISKFIEQLRKNNFAFEEITDEIISIKEFITQDELSQIKKNIDVASQKDWEEHYLSSLPNFCFEKFGRRDVENLVAEGKFQITEGWADKTLHLENQQLVEKMWFRLQNMLLVCDNKLNLSGLATIQRLPPGSELKSHVDQDTDPSIRYASILYLTDDHNGGELFFDNLDVSLRPKPRDLLFFPGDTKHKHGVRHVLDGPTRYVIVGFVKAINFYENNKY